MHSNAVQNGAQTVFSGKSFSTKDYSKFKISPENREVNEYHLRRIIRAIREKNLLPDFPILVTNDMTIIDGQHRYLAAYELGVPIYYRFAEKTEWGDLGFANANVKKWSIRDYHHYWCQKGKEDYLRAQEFINRHPHIRLTTAIPLLTGESHISEGWQYTNSTGRSKWRSDFEGGKWKIGSIKRAEEVAKKIADYRKHYAGYRRIKFVNALMKVMADARYDHSRMMHQLETYGAAVEIRNATRIPDYVDMLNEAYNFNRRHGKGRVLLGVNSN